MEQEILDAIIVLDDAIEEALQGDGFCGLGLTNLNMIKKAFDLLLENSSYVRVVNSKGQVTWMRK